MNYRNALRFNNEDSNNENKIVNAKEKKIDDNNVSSEESKNISSPNLASEVGTILHKQINYN